MMLNKFRFIMIMCFSCFIASSASAAIINNWTYEIDGIFASYTASAGAGGVTGSLDQTVSWKHDSGTLSSGTATGATKLSWGGTTAPSTLQIIDKSGAIVTNDATPVSGLEFLHNNQPISASYATLTGGSVRAVIKITPQDVLGALGPFSTVLNFTFVETSNNSWVPSTDPRNNDVFQLTSAANTVEDFLIHENYIYTLDFNSNLPIIPAGYPGAGNFGWTTVETQTTSIQTLFSIKAREIPNPVPEPSTVLLLGAGLLGLGAVARRRRAN